MTTEERLEKLEQELAAAKRRNRWLVAIMALILMGLACAQAWTFKDRRRVSDLESKVSGLESNVSVLESLVCDLGSRVSGGLSGLHSVVDLVISNVKGLESSLEFLEVFRVSDLESKVKGLESKVSDLEFNVSTHIWPKTIDSDLKVHILESNVHSLELKVRVLENEVDDLRNSLKKRPIGMP